MSDNEIYLLIKYLQSVIWRVAKRLSYTEEERCLKVKPIWMFLAMVVTITVDIVLCTVISILSFKLIFRKCTVCYQL